MAEVTDTIGILKQNLIDSGCNNKLITNCMEFAKEDKWSEILSLLLKQKEDLLREVHIGQKQIDCLDFLVYRINKEHI